MTTAKTGKTVEGDFQLLKNESLLKRFFGKYMITSVLSMLFLYAGSLIVTLLAGHFIGESGLSTMSLVSPVYLIYYTIGSILGIGGSVTASRLIGKEDTEGYKRVFTCSAFLMMILFVIITVLAYVFLKPIAEFLAGNSGEYQHVYDYLKLYIPGGGFTMLAYVPLYFLRIDGKPKLSSLLFLVFALLTVLLSWLYMSPLCHMGISGAALATSISMGVTALLGYVFLLRKNENLNFVPGSIKMENIKNIFISGTPNGSTNLLESARILLLNMLIIGIGAAIYLPCYTVVRNVTDLLGSVMIGVSSALMPFVGMFFGERDYGNVRSVFKLAFRIGLFIMIPLIIAVCIFPDVITAMFGVKDPVLVAADRYALPLSCFGLLASYVNTVLIGFLTATKREGLANFLVSLRLFVYLAVFAFLLSGFMGINGIWLSLSLTEISALLSYFIISAVVRRKHSEYDNFLLNTAYESGDDITFSVLNDVNDIVSASEKIGKFCSVHEIDTKTSMKVSLAIEEVLTILITHCLDKDKEQYIDIRIYKMKQEVLMRFRYMGRIFDPTAYYEKNKENKDMTDELLGLKLIVKSATLINFQQTLGTNSLMIVF